MNPSRHRFWLVQRHRAGATLADSLQQIVHGAGGVFGSRFMGGGFGGCVVGFVKPSHADTAASDILTSYRKLYPKVADQAAVYLAQSDDGVRFI